MSLITLLKDIADASHAGNALQNPHVWANRATSTAALVALFNAIIPITNWVFGVHLALSSGDIQAISGGISVVGVLLVDRLHTAANTEAGH